MFPQPSYWPFVAPLNANGANIYRAEVCFFMAIKCFPTLTWMLQFRTAGVTNQPAFDSVNFYEMACTVCQVFSSFLPHPPTGMLTPPFFKAPTGNEHSFVQAGRQDCPAGFNLDYSGMLLTSHTSHYAMDYICVDGKPEAYGSNLADTAAYLYFTETQSSFANYPNYYEMGVST
jgi:hypothetical protein